MSIGNLKNLQRLEISNNKLFTIPESIGTLMKIEYFLRMKKILP